MPAEKPDQGSAARAHEIGTVATARLLTDRHQDMAHDRSIIRAELLVERPLHAMRGRLDFANRRTRTASTKP